MSLPDAIQEAMESNSRLVAGQARIAVAEGQRQQAGLRPNPRIFLQSEDLRPWNSSFSFPNSTEDYGYLIQTVETAHKRARRLDVANTAVNRARYEQDLTARRIRGAVSYGYWTAATAITIRDLLNESVQTYESDVEYSRNRVTQGQMAEADLIRVELERDRVRAQALLAAQEADAALVGLFRAMARTDFAAAKLTSSIETRPTLAINEVQQVLLARPELQIAREYVAQAEANLRLQQANGVPDPDVQFGFKRNVGLNTLYAAVVIPLPISNRNQGNIAAANAEVHAASADLRTAEASVRADFEGAMRAYRSQLTLLETLPATRARANETARIAREGYRLGGVDLLRLLDSERVRIDTLVTYYRTFQQFQQSVIDLLLASGQDPAPQQNGGYRP